MTRPRILATRKQPEGGRKLLDEAFEVVAHPLDEPMPPAELRAALFDCDALVCVLADRIDADVLAAAPRLRVVANVAVGYDNIDIKAATERGIVVTNTPDVLTETTADLTWALLLGAARHITEADRAVRAGRFKGWELIGYLGRDFFGKTLGVVGFGRIGKAVARRASGFGMRVLYTDPSEAPDMPEAQRVPLETLLDESHFVALHTPLTPDTHHLIDAAALARMRSDAVLVNVARGPVVDEKALVAALREGRIAAAGFDVYENEPTLSPGLADLPNTVLLPHIGSATVDTRTRMSEMAAQSCIDVLAGRRPAHVVNPDVYAD